MSAVDDYYIDLEPGKKCIAIRSRHILIWKGRESDGSYIQGRPINTIESILTDLIVSLRADLQAAQERSAEQARQLEEARSIMQHFTGLKVAADRQMAYDWLAAHPAPSAEPQPPNGEGRP